MNEIAISLAGKRGKFNLDVKFSTPDKGVTAIFGPSGCGKTTILRAIAGLIHLSGTVKLGDSIWQDEQSFVPVYQRQLGYVFQDANLFPHLNVKRNLLFGAPKNSAKQKTNRPTLSFDTVVEMLGLASLIERMPFHLSGGERQRVAIGRALLSAPEILLMDEPLSALDKQARFEILPYLELLRDELQLPIFYISHDMDEVEQLASHLVMMEKGRVVAAGRLRDLQTDLSLPLARDRRASVDLQGEISHFDQEKQIYEILVNGTKIIVPAHFQMKERKLRLRINASDCSLAKIPPQQTSILNVLAGTVVDFLKFNQAEIIAVVNVGDSQQPTKLVVRLSHYSWQKLELKKGDQVYVMIKGVAILAQK